MNPPATSDRTTQASPFLVAIVALMGIAGCSRELEATNVPKPTQQVAKAMGVCPLFPLRDEVGNVIDPVKGVNDGVPYSPKQTCGASGCHDYSKITEGFRRKSAISRPIQTVRCSSAVRQNFNQHLADDPSRPAALLLGYIRQVCALVAPCRTGASSAN
jgi:hypothetical protein